MIDNSLAEYIQSARGQGQTDNQIKQSLLAHGWQETLVDQALGPAIAVGASSVTSSTLPKKHKTVINSAFSVMLAIVLTVALFVLSNKVISDVISAFTHDITASLILSGIIVLPFLLIAFILHFTLGEENEKYLILSRPYYIVAAWLLIRLLYDVSKYLLNQNTAYGVYVVLILIIAVLTGMVIFVQKYLRKI